MSSERPTSTWAPWRPVSPKKTEAKAPSEVLNPTCAYSTICVRRNALPSRIVHTSPARRPFRSSRLMACVAQWMVKLEVTRIAVLTPATNTGNSKGGGGHVAGAVGFTTRTKKYTVKKAPNSIASEAMNRNIPSVVGSSRELRFAGGGP